MFGMEKFSGPEVSQAEIKDRPNKGRIRRWILATLTALSLNNSSPEHTDPDVFDDSIAAEKTGQTSEPYSPEELTEAIAELVEKEVTKLPNQETETPEVIDHKPTAVSDLAPEVSPLPPPAPGRERAPNRELEELSPAEAFAETVRLVETYVQMGRHQVLILNEGRVVGTVDMYDPDTKEPFTYNEGSIRHFAGRFTEDMLLPDGVARSWVRQAVPAQLGLVTAFTEFRSTTTDINSVMRNGSSALQELIRSTPDISRVEVVQYRFSQPVAPDDSRTRIQYISEELRFDPEVLPEMVQNEIRDLLLAVAAQESGGSDAAVSRLGAVGFWQFTPGTWERQHNGDPAKIADFREQVAMVPKHFEQIHRELRAGISGDTYEALRSLYSSDEVFYRDLWVKLMVNAFNAGGPRIAFGVEQFMQQTTAEERVETDDLFAYLAEFMAESTDGRMEGYGDYALGYVPAVYGWQQALVANDIRLLQQEEYSDLTR